jgi:hypothetical protein
MIYLIFNTKSKKGGKLSQNDQLIPREKAIIATQFPITRKKRHNSEVGIIQIDIKSNQ